MSRPIPLPPPVTKITSSVTLLYFLGQKKETFPMNAANKLANMWTIKTIISTITVFIPVTLSPSFLLDDMN